MTDNPGFEEGIGDPWAPSDWEPWELAAHLQPAVVPAWTFDQKYEPGVSMLIDSAGVATRMGRTGIGRWLLRRLLRPLKFSIQYRGPGDEVWSVAEMTVNWK